MFWRSKPHIPHPTGQYVPGCIDVVSEDDGLLRLYYPTDLRDATEHSESWVRWIAHENYVRGMSAFIGIWTWLIKLIFMIFAGDIHIPAVWGGKASQNGPAHPVLVLSHGLAGSRFFYSAMCLEMASNGYVVAVVEHGDGSACATPRRDGWVVYVKIPKVSATHASLRESQIDIRVKEVRAAITTLEDINAGRYVADVGLSGRLDMSQLVLMGHSFGAATALKTLGQEPRFKAGVILDAWMYPLNKYNETLPAEVTQPMIFINTQTFHIEKNLNALTRYIGEHPVYTIRGTTHEHQTDSPHLLGSWLNRRMTKIDYKLATRINDQLILRWLRERIGHGVSDDQFLAAQSHNIIEKLVLATETLA